MLPFDAIEPHSNRRSAGGLQTGRVIWDYPELNSLVRATRPKPKFTFTKSPSAIAQSLPTFEQSAFIFKRPLPAARKPPSTGQKSPLTSDKSPPTFKK